MIFRTVTGSCYQVDGLRVRRVSGLKEPTARFGCDDEWRTLEYAPRVRVGSSVLFVWAPGITPEPAPGTDAGTLTSPVVEIVDESKGTA